MPSYGHHSFPKALTWTKSHFNSGKHLLICPSREPSAIFQWAQKKEMGYALSVSNLPLALKNGGWEIISTHFFQASTQGSLWVSIEMKSETKVLWELSPAPADMENAGSFPWHSKGLGKRQEGKKCPFIADTKGLQIHTCLTKNKELERNL